MAHSSILDAVLMSVLRPTRQTSIVPVQEDWVEAHEGRDRLSAPDRDSNRRTAL